MSDRTDELLEELVRLQVHSLRAGMESQADAIEVLDTLGFEPARIAELLQTSTATVRVAKQRLTKRAAKSGTAKKGSV